MTKELPVLYRGVSKGIRYTGFDWRAFLYLTDDLETAAIYGRAGTTRRAVIRSAIDVLDADAPSVRDVERAENPRAFALGEGIDAIWNRSGHWQGKVHPHEFIVFSRVPVGYEALTKKEREFANRIKSYFPR